MCHQVIWTKVILDEFIKAGNLNLMLEKLIRMRAAGSSRIQQAMELNMSIPQLDRIIARLKIKYDAAQMHSLILPPRKDNAKELYLDAII